MVNRIIDLMDNIVQYSKESTANTFLNAATALGIPFEKVTGGATFWLLGEQERKIWLYRNILGVDSSATRFFIQQKAASQSLLQKHSLPVPPFLYKRLRNPKKRAVDDLRNFARQHYPVVVKPSAQSRSRGVYTDVRSDGELMRVLAYEEQSGYNDLIVEKHIYGDIYRVLVFEDEVIDVVKWSLSAVTGDGKSTVRELVVELNNRELASRVVKVNVRLVDLLHKQGLRLDDVAPSGSVIKVSETIGFKGCKRQRIVLTRIPQDIKMCFVKACRVSGARFLGIDVICDDITGNSSHQSFYINEMNSSPALRLQYPNNDDNDFQPAMRILTKIFRV